MPEPPEPALNGTEPDWAFERLDPGAIMAALESTGLLPDGHLLALNSYENRVYRVGLEDAPPVVAKFYRPGRWSDAQIVEELDFTLELAAADVPVVAPLVALEAIFVMLLGLLVFKERAITLRIVVSVLVVVAGAVANSSRG